MLEVCPTCKDTHRRLDDDASGW